MKQLKRIVVGHALRAGEKAVLESAVALANRCGAALRLVHVIEPIDTYQRLSHPLTSPYTLEQIAQKIRARLKTSVAGPEFTGLEVQSEVRSGKPFVELIIAARAWRADLIVVGAGSESAAPFLGSTSERIVRKADTPVMVARRPLKLDAKVFLVPTDFSSYAKNAAREALMLAQRFSGRIVFFHVWELYLSRIAYAHELGVSVPILPLSPQEIEPEWEAFLSGLPLDGVDWEKHSGEGQAAAAIVRHAENIEADLIVIGTHGRSGLPHMLLGSVAEKVVRTASCAVLAIRPGAFQFKLP